MPSRAPNKTINFPRLWFTFQITQAFEEKGDATRHHPNEGVVNERSLYEVTIIISFALLSLLNAKIERELASSGLACKSSSPSH